MTGIHAVAHDKLVRHLKLDSSTPPFADEIQQVAKPNEKLLTTLGVDTRGLFPLCSHNWNVEGRDVGEFLEYVDEWGFTQHLPKDGGLWWSLVKSPLDGATIDPDAVRGHSWPNPTDSRRIEGLRELAKQYRSQDKIVMIKGLCAGLFEMGQRLRGMENFLCDCLVDPQNAGLVLDKILELKIAFWDMALSELGDVIDVVVETDDYGTQESQLISPDVFRSLFRPRLKELVTFIKRKLAEKKSNGEKGYVFFHSCGNVRPILPDFIDMGIDILNPVHISATGMSPKELKADFGSEITFWGGGVETQNVLPNGSPDDVREDVKRNVDALAPDGGFVFATVHNIQAEVPPANVMAMWETMREHGAG